MQRTQASSMDTKLETRSLRYFMQVMDSGSVRGAADALGMDASAVSRSLSLLERDCGTQLFERRGRGIVPTEAGQLLAAYLRRQQSEKRNLLARMENIRKIESGHIDIVSGEGYVDWLMRKSLRRFMRMRPKITMSFDIGSTDQIVQSIVEERAHIGVLFNPPKDDRLRSHHSYPQPISALVLPSHPLAKLDRPLKLEDLAPYPGAALHSSFGIRQHVQAAEISEGIRLNVTFTTSSFDAIGHFVTAGLGYAFVSRLALAPADAAKVTALPMKNPLLHRGRTHVVSRHGRLLPAAAAELLKAIIADMKASSAGKVD
jgi:DNA-binding transcriptional LysR family regulator